MSKSKTQTKVEVVPIEQLIADPRNVRLHPDRSKDALSKSVEVFGAARSVVADKDGVVRAGNGTLEAARAAGIKEAIVIEADGKQLVVVKRPDWTNEQAIAYAIADNRTGELSTWDEKQAAAVARELCAAGGDALLLASGFGADELAVLFGENKIVVNEHLRERSDEDIKSVSARLFSVIVDFDNEQDQKTFAQNVENKGHKTRFLIT